MLLMLNNKYRQRGVTLIEIMLSIAIIALILILATRYYSSTKRSKEITEAVSLIQSIRAAATNYETPSGYRSGMTMKILIDAGLLPKDIKDASKASPWGTAMEADTKDDTLVITMVTPVGAAGEGGVCRLILENLKIDLKDPDKDGTCAAGKLSVTYKK